MERLLVVWCPALAEEQEDGRRGRAFARVATATAAFSPAVQVVRAGALAMPTRGPSRYFGGDDLLARRVLGALVAELAGAAEGAELAGGGTAADRTAADRTAPAGARPVQVGVADGLFAALLAARAATDEPVVVPPGATTGFLAPWPVEVLDRPELADLLRRLGVHTLGAFAALPTRHVLARLGAGGTACHEVARGIRGELAGVRAPLRTVAPRGDEAGPVRQPGFWGGAAAAERRAEQAVARAAALLHPEAVAVGRLQGGRSPAERARLVPWAGRHVAAGRPGEEPWPGRIPSPAPAVVFGRPLPAVLLDARGDGVGVAADGTASGAPARLSVSGGPWAAVTAWAGPWPADVRWWSGRGRRRQARMQLVTASGAAYLLVRERGGWWVEGAYD